MKKIFCIFITLFLVSFSFLSASAVYYDDTFPSAETGLTGGLFLECETNIGKCVIVVPYNYKNNTFTFSTSGNVFNATSTSISCTLFRNGQQYTCRWAGYSFPEYRLEATGYQYSDLTITKVTDTNIVFITDDDELSNDNYYLSVYEKIIISLLSVIVFLLFLMWFLLHRR